MPEHNHLGPWDPLTPSEIAALFAEYAGRWCIAGGWALDLFAGVQSRVHDDIDVLVVRDHLSLLHAALPGWELHAASGATTLWKAGTALPDGVHDIWCRQRVGQRTGQRVGQRTGQRVGQANGPWRFQLMVVNTDASTREWHFRRDDRIRGPLGTMILMRDGMQILAPEIQLLYKSKLPNRPKDEADFATTAPHLSPMQRVWLANAMTLLYSDHPWFATLRSE